MDGGAIRNNIGNVDGIIKNINATFFIVCLQMKSSTGETSWCKFQRAKAKNEVPPPRLSKRELLDRCTLGATQNQNESFNKTVWARASKNQFLSKPIVILAVDLAVITLNEGMEIGLPKLLAELDIEEGPCLKAYFSTTDEVMVAKKCRRDKTIAMAATEERLIDMEGITYGPAQF